jgi:hypothetical protein
MRGDTGGDSILSVSRDSGHVAFPRFLLPGGGSRGAAASWWQTHVQPAGCDQMAVVAAPGRSTLAMSAGVSDLRTPLSRAGKMYREMDMRFWLEKAEAEMRESG